jgi:hypothetical protein
MLRSHAKASLFCSQSCVWTSGALYRVCAVREEMTVDDDTADLVRLLCTRAGMIMEDASSAAILIGGKAPAEMLVMIKELQLQTMRSAALLAAARAMLD